MTFSRAHKVAPGKLLLVLFLGITLFSFCADSLFAQSIGDFRSRASDRWSRSNTWDEFTATGWQNTSNVPTSLSGVVTIQNGHVVQANTAGSYDQLIVELGGELQITNTFEIVVARTSNLRSIRMIASDICALHAPDGAPKNVYIQFTDLDAIQTRVTIKTVIQDQSLSSTELADALNLALREFGPIIESTVQTYPGLRLIKSSGDKAA